MKRNESVSKAVAILRAVAEAPDGETASGLARATALPHPTALRLIRTLEEEGFVARMPGATRYVLGVDLLRIAGGETVELLIAAARPALEDLAERASETSTLAVPRRESIEVVLQVDGPHMVGVIAWTGGRFPLHATSSGKVVLASWDPERLERYLRSPLEPLAAKTITDPGTLRREIARVRERGYSTTIDELEAGLTAIGAPVFEAPHQRVGRRPTRLLAVVNLSGPSFRFDKTARGEAIELVKEAAADVERRLRPAVDAMA